MIAFGPIPSRRLGRSLGVNNIPPKNCTYSCAYCQVGRAISIQTEPCTFYNPSDIADEVGDKISKAKHAGERIDYLTFVPDGEPTLDVNIGQEIGELNSFGIKTAVITNASLLWREEIRERLMQANWVSVKVDAIDPPIWRRVNRPHRSLDIGVILDGIKAFARDFPGQIATETMLVEGVNDSESNAKQVADFLASIGPDTAYVSIPTRPPAASWAHAPGVDAVNSFYQVLSKHLDSVEHLTGYEGNAFAFTGDAQEDLLSITAVHPMREEAVEALLARAGTDWTVVEELLSEGKLKMAEYEEKKYFIRALNSFQEGA